MPETEANHWLEREDIGDVTVVRVQVPKLLDDSTTRGLFDQMYTLVGVDGRSKLVLNLSAVQSLASMALGKMIMLNRKAQAAAGRLALCCLSPGTVEVMESTHLMEVFTIYAGEPEALQSFA
jgi:anti-sigma B factor antagonist